MNTLLISILAAGIINTVPESNPQSPLLTMEQTFSTKVYPVRVSADAKEKALGITAEEPDLGFLPTSGDGIVYGEAVSRHEFGIDAGVFPSPDGNRVAFYRKDESRVTEFPLLDISTRTGSLEALRYPMNGMPSELINLGIYDRASGETIYVEASDFSEERYLTCISWTPDSKTVCIQVVDREQHNMHLNLYDAASGKQTGSPVLTEHNDAWIEPLDPVFFLDNTHFIYRTDNRDGWRNLYLCGTDGKIKRLTKCNADVELLGVRDGWIYYTSAEVSPVENHLFRMKTNGKCKQRLTSQSGWHSITLGPEGYVDEFSSFADAGWTKRYDLSGKCIETLASNETDPLAGFARCEVEFGSVKAADGQTDNYYRFYKPLGFDPAKKYPLIVYVYGGPHSQMVQDKWLGSIRMWEMYMAQRGYAVYVQDNRGTSNRGAAFEKAINRQCGQVEMQDQIAGLDALLERCEWIDRERIGVHGWSYGGFMTISLATNYPEYFKVAVAGGPVIDWKWYEVMYGERYMDTPETNPEGFSRTSLIGKAADLKARLLICQGAIDDTVVWQHSLSFVQECIDNNIPVDYFPFPKARHNMKGDERVYLHRLITDYFEKNL